MNDLISRQAAIDAVDVLCQEHRYRIPGKRETYSQYNEAWQDALDRAEGAIGNLPSAQPEIIRCKDCKYWMPHSQLGYDEDNEAYHDYCEKLIPEDEYYAFYRDADDYCSRAERRTDG